MFTKHAKISQVNQFGYSMPMPGGHPDMKDTGMQPSKLSSWGPLNLRIDLKSLQQTEAFLLLYKFSQYDNIL